MLGINWLRVQGGSPDPYMGGHLGMLSLINEAKVILMYRVLGSSTWLHV